MFIRKHAIGRCRLMDSAWRCVHTTSRAAKKTKTKSGNSGSNYAVNLPQTEFQLRANAKTREPILAQRWANVYETQRRDPKRTEEFILHDGPPYANGDLHVGHALNKTLKDMIIRTQLLSGKKVHYVPGWDCHGLPIELKALDSLPKKKKKRQDPAFQGLDEKAQDPSVAREIRALASDFADAAVQNQMQDFIRIGVIGDWANRYITKTKKYEVAQLEIFAKLVEKGLINRKLRPVYWSPWTKTALAEAELEYEGEHVSRSVFFRTPLNRQQVASLDLPSEDVSLLAWTTTPWTIPANQALCVARDAQYVAVPRRTTEGTEGYDIIMRNRVEALQQEYDMYKGISAKDLVEVQISEVVDTDYNLIWPTPGFRKGKIFYSDHVDASAGTGVVHTAPAHGLEDFDAWLQRGYETFPSLVDEAGKYNANAPSELVGLPVLGAGKDMVVEHMKSHDLIAYEHLYTHRYPYDWRAKQPVILRATSQWFADITDVQGTALELIESVPNLNTIPTSGRHRLSATVESRTSWCISRQRLWGVPIPCFYDLETGEPLMTPEIIRYVRDQVAEHGSGYWFSCEGNEGLLPKKYRDRADELKRGTDTMDVWFDSGSSWASVLLADDAGKQVADVYLEGSDQHRGWFQSSALLSVACQGTLPYKTLITHGFTLDEFGRKMSKSIGNVISPDMVINGATANPKEWPGHGADVLRLWVASTDYTSDQIIGVRIIGQVSEVYRRWRNVMRFLLGNLNDVPASGVEVERKTLDPLNLYMLHRLAVVNNEVQSMFRLYNFSSGLRLLHDFIVNDLSAFYFTISKDTLYTDVKDSPIRRMTQSTLNEVLNTVLPLTSVVSPHLAEDVLQHHPLLKVDNVFDIGFSRLAPKAGGHEEAYVDMIHSLRYIRRCIDREYEAMESSPALPERSALSVKVVIPDRLGSAINETPNLMEKLNDILGCSHVDIHGWQDDIEYFRSKSICEGEEIIPIHPSDSIAQTLTLKERSFRFVCGDPTLLKCDRCRLFRVEPEKSMTLQGKPICTRCYHAETES
eukprot:Clim_evm63s134 gene=Clim_evmTU63s134